MKMGLRYEYTTTELNAEGKPAIVDRKYGRLFPSFFINRKINDNNSLNFSYSRRINRPKLSNLAPFIIFIDPYTFLSGNVNLKPAITDAVLATYTYKKIMFSMGYSYETNTIADFQTSVDVATNKQYLQAQNLENNQLVSGTISVPVTVTKWWNMYANITAIYQRVQSNLSNNPLTLTLGNTNIFTSQNFTLPKNYSMELSGFLQTASLAGIYRLEAFGRLDIGIQKKFKDNSNLRLNVQDLLASFNWRLVADRPEQSFYTRTLANFSQRIFRLTYTRSFGNKQLKEKRNRSTASEEELKRVND
jgi:outer membrane receptor protein involved in Fe transport